MLKIFVPENWEEDNLVEMIFDNEPATNKNKMDLNKLNSWIEDSMKDKGIVVEIEYKLVVKQISIEAYEGEYDVILNTFTYKTVENKLEYDYSDKHLKTYKNKKSADKFAREQVQLNNAIWRIKEL